MARLRRATCIRACMMYSSQLSQIEDGHVVRVVPSPRLVVIGRTLEEARAWARSAIGRRGVGTSQRAEPSGGNRRTRAGAELQRGLTTGYAQCSGVHERTARRCQRQAHRRQARWSRRSPKLPSMARSDSVLAKSVRRAAWSIDPSANASHVLGHRRRNATLKLRRTNLLRCDAVNAASINSNRLS
jgi:hypothetical protein